MYLRRPPLRQQGKQKSVGGWSQEVRSTWKIHGMEEILIVIHPGSWKQSLMLDVRLAYRLAILTTTLVNMEKKKREISGNIT